MTRLPNLDNSHAELSYLLELVLIVKDVRPFHLLLLLFLKTILKLGVYLHDPRCICKDAKTKTRKKNKEDVVLDSLFWPVMPVEMVNQKKDRLMYKVS